ncbi:MAG: hypothetical protein ACREO5_06000, partial [Candidatus Binatia bacterium]
MRLTTQLQQRMVLTPQLRQRIEMLQMTSLELSELIEQELVSNIILEEVQPGEEVKEISDSIIDQNADGREELSSSSDQVVPFESPTETVADYEGDGDHFLAELPGENGASEKSPADLEFGDESNQERSDSFEEIDYGREFQDYLDPGYRTQEIEYKDDAPSFEQFLSHSPSLIEHLEWQLNMIDMSEEMEVAAKLIIGNLDEDGRLAASVEEIAEGSALTVEGVERARKLVMSLEPVGCGAINVNECLLAQLESNGEGQDLAAELVRNHLEDLQPHWLQHLSKHTGVDVHV